MTDNRTTETAIDRLRTLLDEHDVEHFDGTEQTLWGYEPTGEDTGIYRFAANEIRDGFLQFSMFRITPEQAIAATLGSGTCENSAKEWGEKNYYFVCSECGWNLANVGRVSIELAAEMIKTCPRCGKRVSA